MGGDPDVVVPEDELGPEPVREQLAEEVEQGSPQRRRDPNDRMFCVPHDDDAVDPLGFRCANELSGQLGSLRARRAEGPLRARAQPEVEVGDEEPCDFLRFSRGEPQGRPPEERSKLGWHSPATSRPPLGSPGSQRHRFEPPSAHLGSYLSEREDRPALNTNRNSFEWEGRWSVPGSDRSSRSKTFWSERGSSSPTRTACDLRASTSRPDVTLYCSSS